MSWSPVPRTARVADIIAVAARLTDVTEAEIRSPARTMQVNRVRQAVYYVARLNGHSYPRIGHFIGRDHSSVIHGVDVAAERARREPAYAMFLIQLAEDVQHTKPFIPAPVALSAAIPSKPEPPAPRQAVAPPKPKATCKPKNNFDAKPIDRDAGHQFHASVATGSSKLAKALAAARAA